MDERGRRGQSHPDGVPAVLTVIFLLLLLLAGAAVGAMAALAYTLFWGIG